MTMIVLFDFTKAFDCIPHKNLLSKLRKLGIEEGPIRWTSSYLMSRRQSFRDETGRPNGYRPVASGVSQGSILGPLHFALFIRDLPKVLSTPHAEFTPMIHKFITTSAQLSFKLPLQGLKLMHRQLRIRLLQTGLN